MDLVPLVTTIIAAVIALGCAVWSTLMIRRAGGDPELRGDVDELAIMVERLAKSHRREQMQRVRAAPAGPDGQGAVFSKPAGAPDMAPAQGATLTKEELRRRYVSPH